MNNSLDRFNNGFNSDTIKEIKSINEKIKKETDKDELLKLRLQRMCKGFEINAGAIGRLRNGYYPY